MNCDTAIATQLGKLSPAAVLCPANYLFSHLRSCLGAGADLAWGQRGAQAPLPPETPWKVEARRREKKGKERREEEEGGLEEEEGR